MIFGHDFKYQIPEMDDLLGVSADLGIHYDTDSEYLSRPMGRDYLSQIVNAKIGDTVIQLMVTSHDFIKREVETL
jgi:hypothetical protein